MEFSQELINVFNYLGSKVGIAIDWTSENVIPYVTQLCEKYISYEMFTSIAWIVIIFSVTAFFTFLSLFFHKQATKVEYDFDRWTWPWFATVSWCFLTVMVIATIFVTGTQVFDIIECAVLPEKTILEYLNSLINTVK